MKKIILFILILFLCCGNASAWYNNDWLYSKEITINQTMVNDSIGNIHYTMLLNITDADLAADAQTDGDDIIFVDFTNTTQLNHQISIFNSTTGHLKAWINITDISNVTSIYMYYGNASVVNSEDKAGTWGVDAKGIWLCDEGAGNYVNDSSGNNNNGTIDGAIWVDGGLEFDGDNDLVTCGHDSSLQVTNNHSILAWAYNYGSSTLNEDQFIISKRHGNYEFGFNAVGDRLKAYTDTQTTVSSISTFRDDWHLVSMSYNAVNDNVYYYRDGISLAYANAGAYSPTDATYDVVLGDRYSYSNRHFNGSMREVRLYDCYLAVEFIETTYNNTIYPSLFISVGTEQNRPPSSQINITLHSKYPTTLYTNYTGLLLGSYIVESNYPLNYSSLAFLMGVNYTLTSDYHSYLKVPSNSIAVDGIYRGHNRNTTPYMSWENNDTITEGNVWKWSGGDNNSFWITKTPINATHTWVNITGVASNVFTSMFYIDRTAMYEAPKTGYEINQHQGIIIKMWDLEGFRGRNNDYWINMYFDTMLEATPTQNIDLWYCNHTFDPTSDDPTVCDSCVRMDTWNYSRWMDHETWQPHVNVSYSKPLSAYAGQHPEIPPDEIIYIYLASNTLTSKSYILNTTNYDPGLCNITYAQTQTMWLYNELSDTSTPLAYTPSFFATFVRDYQEFTHHLYIANDEGVWGHSDYTIHTIGISNINPTHCKYNYFWWDNETDYNMNGSYNQSFYINLTYGIDPDNGADLTHVLSLYDDDYNFIAIINSSLVGNGSDTDIFFDITDYKSNSVYYRFKIVSTDNEASISVAWSEIFDIPEDNRFINTIEIIKGFPNTIINILNTFLSYLPLFIGILISGFLLIICVGVFSKFKRW